MRKLVILGLFLAPLASVSAQKGTELSFRVANIGVSSSGGSSVTGINIGGGGVALGLYLSEGMALEPSVALSFLHSEGESLTQANLGLALPIYFAKDWGHSGLYLAPSVGLKLFSGDGFSANQLFVGGELGTKSRVSDVVSLRFGVNVTMGLENDDFDSATSVTGFFGVSVFFKK